MSSTPTSLSPTSVATSLRKLYFFRFGFALVWAAVVFAIGSSLSPITAVVLVLYPLFDLAAAIVDVRASRAAGSVRLLYVNMALSLLAAVGLAIAATSGAPAVLRVWGAWALTAGLVQLIVGIRRRALGGQWIMIISGGLSVLVGAAFIGMASGASASVTSLGGYATLGGVFFLISALRLRRAAKGL
ncbi:hypothetical protein [Glaciihabitans sp. dw_435]|uniref:hypothetical protein n=1 Tax=Glaciihabitans sp. dw_435 TaxID=2720081 RepID=UPI001BD4FBA0|nr:hypothetical protein [Glaciihabitans sp. dw_435]